MLFRSLSARLSGVYISDGHVRTAKLISAAATGNRTAAEQVMRDDDANLTSKPIPSTSGLSAIVACDHAEAYALLGDTAAMYPNLDRCVAGPSGAGGAFGVYPAILRRLPLYAPYRDQPHFKRIVDNMIVFRKARR